MACFCPSGFGAVILFPLPSEDEPIAGMTAYILFSSLIASSNLFKTINPAPSPITKPSALSSKGQEPFAERALILLNFT